MSFWFLHAYLKFAFTLNQSQDYTLSYCIICHFISVGWIWKITFQYIDFLLLHAYLRFAFTLDQNQDYTLSYCIICHFTSVGWICKIVSKLVIFPREGYLPHNTNLFWVLSSYLSHNNPTNQDNHLDNFHHLLHFPDCI